MKEQDKFFEEGVIWKVSEQIEKKFDTEEAKIVHGKINPVNFVLFDDGKLVFEDMEDKKELNSQPYIHTRKKKEVEEDYVIDI